MTSMLCRSSTSARKPKTATAMATAAPRPPSVFDNSPHPHRQFDILGKGRRHVAVSRRAYACEIVGAEIGVVSDNNRARPQPALDQIKYFRIERLGAVEQQQIDRVGKIDAERLQRIALADLDEIDETAGRQVIAGLRDFRRLEFAGDEVAAAIVAQRGRKVQGRDAERGAKLDDRAGA